MKVLLLSDIPPCKDFTAGLVLDQLCKFLPRDTLCCFAVVNPSLAMRMSPDFSGVPALFRAKPNENWNWLPSGKLSGRLAAAFVFAAEWRTRRRHVAALVKEAIEFGRKQNVDRVWAVLQGQTTIRMAGQVAKGLGVPLHTQVWDPFSWWASANRLDARTTRQTLTLFDETIRQSKSCATASIPMAQEYETRFGIKALPVISSHDLSMAQKPDVAAGIGERLTIGMAGQFYAQNEWSQLIHALDCAKWEVAGRPVDIIVMGPQAPIHARPGRVDYLGWKSQQEAAEILARCDVLYCPYPFAQTMKEVSQYSFPSKLVLYLAAGRPVLFHGPDYSAPSSYILKNKVGVRCSQLAASAVYNELERLADTPALYMELGRNAQAAFVRDFSLKTMSQAFRSFLDFEAADSPLCLHDHRRISGPEQPIELAAADRDASFSIRWLRRAQSTAAKYPALKSICRRSFSAPSAASAISSTFTNSKARMRHALKIRIRSLVLRIPRINSMYHEIHSLYQQKSDLLAALESQASTSEEKYRQLQTPQQAEAERTAALESQLQIVRQQFAAASSHAKGLTETLTASKQQLADVETQAKESQQRNVLELQALQKAHAEAAKNADVAMARLKEENAELHYYLGNQPQIPLHQVSVKKIIDNKQPLYFTDAAEFATAARQAIIETDVVLDIGCGIRPQNFFHPHVHICIEPFDEYVKILQNRALNNPSFVIIKSEALNALLQLPDRSVDSIFMLDVIEHLDKDQGLAVLRECERVARRQISVFTPLGFMPQDYAHDEKDAWGLSGASMQAHLSGWLPEDFSEEWNFLICENYHGQKAICDASETGMVSHKTYGAFWAIRTIGSHRPRFRNRTLFIGKTLPPAPAPSEEWDNLWKEFSAFDAGSFGCVTSFELSPNGMYLQTSRTRLPVPYSYISFSPILLLDPKAGWSDVEKIVPRATLDRVLAVLKEGSYEAIVAIVVKPAEAAFALLLGHESGLPVTLLTLEGGELPKHTWFSEYPLPLTVLSPRGTNLRDFAGNDKR